MSQDELSRIISWSKATIARVEKAQQVIPPSMPAALDAAFGTRQFSDLYILARKEAHPDWVRQRMDFEDQAVVIEEYGPQASLVSSKPRNTPAPNSRGRASCGEHRSRSTNS